MNSIHPEQGALKSQNAYTATRTASSSAPIGDIPSEQGVHRSDKGSKDKAEAEELKVRSTPEFAVTKLDREPPP